MVFDRIKKGFSDAFSGAEDPEYIEIDLGREMKRAKVIVRPFVLKSFEDVNPILNALRAGVDLKKGGDVAQNLYDLYDYCYRTLFHVSAQNDVALLNEVLEHITLVSEAWKEMPDNFKRVSKEQFDKVKG